MCHNPSGKQNSLSGMFVKRSSREASGRFLGRARRSAAGRGAAGNIQHVTAVWMSRWGITSSHDLFVTMEICGVLSQPEHHFLRHITLAGSGVCERMCMWWWWGWGCVLVSRQGSLVWPIFLPLCLDLWERYGHTATVNKLRSSSCLWRM